MDDYECFAGLDACCPRCGAQIGHVRGHFFNDCLKELRERSEAAEAALKAPVEVVVDSDEGVYLYDMLEDAEDKYNEIVNQARKGRRYTTFVHRADLMLRYTRLRAREKGTA